MTWAILLGSLLIGLMLIRFSYKLEKRRRDKDKQETEQAMKEFAEMLKKQNKDHAN